MKINNNYWIDFQTLTLVGLLILAWVFKQYLPYFLVSIYYWNNSLVYLWLDWRFFFTWACGFRTIRYILLSSVSVGSPGIHQISVRPRFFPVMWTAASCLYKSWRAFTGIFFLYICWWFLILFLCPFYWCEHCSIFFRICNILRCLWLGSSSENSEFPMW